MSNGQAKTATKPNGEKKFFEINKKKVLLSLLAAAALPFLLLIAGTIETYFNNEKEFTFLIGDFAPLVLLIALGVFVLIAAVLLLLRGTAFKVVFAVVSWLVVCSYVQVMLLNRFFFTSLYSDGNVQKPPVWWLVVDIVIWIIIGAAIFWFCVLSQKHETGRSVVAFMLALVIVMQGSGLVASALSSDGNKDNGYLTTQGINEVSSKDNIMLFIVDRFDKVFYDNLIASDPDFFNDFDGFTYYPDNISLYARTYPATVSMLTGVENDFSGTMADYFKKAYNTGTFLPDLVANDYKINLYISKLYCYDDASVMSDFVSNIAYENSGERTVETGQLLGNIMKLGLSRYAPDAAKEAIGIKSNAFGGVVSYSGQNPTTDDLYETNDSKVIADFRSSGLTVQEEKNQFMCLHLRGCHSPYNINADGVYVGDNNTDEVSQTKGILTYIKEYIAQLKEKGLYENSTIIITGDHASAISDFDDVGGTRLTTLMVKEKGAASTPYRVSNAPVSQSNLLAEFVKSAGITTTHNYGVAYSDISENATTTRRYLFQKSSPNNNHDEIVEYTITGSALDFNNWKIKSRTDIGGIYD